MKQIKTGIAGFDWFLKGGLPPRVLLLSGIPGSGNEVFARQTAFAQAKQKSISYFTVHATSDHIKEAMLAYGWDIEQLEKTGQWKFHKIKGDDFVDAIINAIKQNRIVVIDSLSELLLTHEIEEIIQLFTAMALHNKGNTEFHMLLLTEGMHNRQVETTMEHFAEGVIQFNTTWNGDSTLRHILVKKMHGTMVPTRQLQYNLGKKGLVIETATRIN